MLDAYNIGYLEAVSASLETCSVVVVRVFYSISARAASIEDRVSLRSLTSGSNEVCLALIRWRRGRDNAQ